MMHWIDIKHVKIFIAVAENRSFTKAAEKLQIAQPWLSVQVRKLEESLGFPLFSRGRKQMVEPTAKAQELLPAAYEFVKAQEKLIAAAGAIRRGESLMLMIGAPEFSIDIAERHELIGQLQTRFPKIEIEIFNGYSVTLIEQMRSGELDVSFMLGPMPLLEFESLVVAATELALLLPADHRLATAETIHMDDLRGLTIGNFRRKFNPPVYDLMAQAFADRGVLLENCPESSAMGMCHYVAREHKPALVTEWVRGSLIHSNALVLRPIDDPSLRLELLLTRRRGDHRPAVEAVWQCAQWMIEAGGRLAAE